MVCTPSLSYWGVGGLHTMITVNLTFSFENLNSCKHSDTHTKCSFDNKLYYVDNSHQNMITQHLASSKALLIVWFSRIKSVSAE